ELLASTDWLAGELSRPDVRIVDCRWRPDGTGQALFAEGHIPGATSVDWRTELNEAASDEPGEALRLAGPESVLGFMRRAGVGAASSLVLYDDTLGLYAARAGWSLRVYGFEAAPLLAARFPAWAAEQRPLSTGVLPHPDAAFTPRLNPRLRLTTTDVRSLLGSPAASVVDRRGVAQPHSDQHTT